MFLILTNLVQHLVTFVQNECLDVAQREFLLADQGIQTTGGTDNDVGERLFVRQDFNVLLDRSTSVEDCSLHIGKVLAESRILVLDLIRQFTGVAHNKDRTLSRNGLELMEGSQNEDRRLTETRLGLAQDVNVQNGGRNADLLDCNKAETAC